MDTKKELSDLILSFLKPPKHSGGSWTLNPDEAAEAVLAFMDNQNHPSVEDARAEAWREYVAAGGIVEEFRPAVHRAFICGWEAHADLAASRAVPSDRLDRVTDLFEKWAAEENEHRQAGEYGLAEGLKVAIDDLRAAIHGAASPAVPSDHTATTEDAARVLHERHCDGLTHNRDCPGWDDDCAAVEALSDDGLLATARPDTTTEWGVRNPDGLVTTHHSFEKYARNDSRRSKRPVVRREVTAWTEADRG